MSNQTHLSPAVARLIRELAYAKALLANHKAAADRAWRHLVPIADEFRLHRMMLRETQLRIKALTDKLGETTCISVADIRAIQNWPKTLGKPHGHIMDEMVRYLKAADGPVSTNMVVSHMVKTIGIPVSTSAERILARANIRKRMRDLAAKGIVIRLPDISSPSGQFVGCWLWKGL